MTASTDTTVPVFYETLAAAAQCTPADAFEHFNTTQAANDRGRQHPVEAFLEDYAPIGAAK